jgi:hypothetical protein
MEDLNRTTFKWDENLKTHIEAPCTSKSVSGENKEGLWVAFNYKKIMRFARETHNPALAVLAELHRLQFKSWNKRKPVILNCSTLGFKRHSVMRALKCLEKQGWVSIRLEKGQSPRVRILQGFDFKH